jgi:hypothetical protein
MLFLLVGSATGAFAAVGSEASCDDCGEQDTGCCPPVCAQCVCAARSITADVPDAIASLPPADGSVVSSVGEEDGAPESAEPAEIFHVPIATG